MSGLLEFLRCRALCGDLRAGRAEAIDELFALLADPLYHHALSITRRVAEAEEVLQDVFMELVRHPDRLRGVFNLKAYLFRAVRNRALNRGRGQNREVTLEPTLCAASGADPTAQTDAMALEQALDRLPPEQREIVTLKTWQGLSFREIAELLDLSPNTAASRYRYALEHLKKELA